MDDSDSRERKNHLSGSCAVPTHRVLIHGLPYFARMLGDLLRRGEWEIRYHLGTKPLDLIGVLLDLHRCDLAYKIGGRLAGSRFIQAAKLLGKKKLIMHWVGSDVLFAQRFLSQGAMPDPWVMCTPHHWAEVPWIADELRQMGLECDVVPLTSARLPTRPLPLSEEFRVLVYLPSLEKAKLYGLDHILQVARELSAVPFWLVGIAERSIPDPPANMKVVGWVPDLASIYPHVTALWRPTSHDGLSFMVLEALGFGRYVLWSYDFPGSIRVADAADARRELQRLIELHQQKRLKINQAGSDFVAEKYQPQFVVENILRGFTRVLSSK